MSKFELSATYNQLLELKEHLYMNGYHFILDIDESTIEIDDEEVSYLKTICNERGIYLV